MKNYKLYYFIPLTILGWIHNARSTHVCDRPCHTYGQPKLCDYEFKITLGRTLDPKHCGNCTSAIEDCYKDNCVVGDGLERPVYLVNEMFPGPDITVCEGDTVRIVVTNGLVGAEATVLHWHGIHQVGTPYMDGVPMITQCPVNMGAKFRYLWKADPPGSKFWHAHSSAHRVDGIVGPMLVRPLIKPLPEPAYYVSSSVHQPPVEFTVIVQEWKDSLAPFHFIKDDEAAPSLIINGRQGSWPDSPPAYFLVPKRSQPKRSPAKPLTLPQLTSHLPLFRLVSNGFLYCPIVITVENHAMVVSGLDGFPVTGEATIVQALTIFPGERYDVWLANLDTYPNLMSPIGAKLKANELKLAYKIEVVSFGECDHGTKVANASAFIMYAPGESFGDAQAISYIKHNLFNERFNLDQTTVERLNHKLILNPVHLKSWKNSSYNVPVTRLTMDLPTIAPLLSRVPDYKLYLFTDSYLLGADIPMFNNLSFIPTTSPILSQTRDVSEEELCNPNTRPECNKIFCRCTHLYQIKLGSLVEMIIVDEGLNGEYDIHSVHLHGYHFAVLAQEKLGDTLRIEDVAKLDSMGKLVRNLQNPILKDTVAIPEGGYVIIRFLADNPGCWLFHCHLDFHLMKGMALIFRVGDELHMPRVPSKFPQCGDWYKDNVTQKAISFKRFEPLKI